jgi:hypothetical protein
MHDTAENLSNNNHPLINFYVSSFSNIANTICVKCSCTIIKKKNLKI